MSSKSKLTKIGWCTVVNEWYEIRIPVEENVWQVIWMPLDSCKNKEEVLDLAFEDEGEVSIVSGHGVLHNDEWVVHKLSH